MPKKRPPQNVERLDPEVEEIIRQYSALTPAEKIAYGRASSLRTIMRWRMMSRNHPDAFERSFYRERIREGQIRLLELRAWRTSGIEPGRA